MVIETYKKLVVTAPPQIFGPKDNIKTLIL